MAQITGPDFVALQVRDLTAAHRFYTEVLGLREAPTSPPNAVVFATAPIPLAVREATVDLAATPLLGWGIALWLHVDDASALHDHLVAQGVPITQPLFTGPFGRTFVFRDPDGYSITIHDGQ